GTLHQLVDVHDRSTTGHLALIVITSSACVMEPAAKRVDHIAPLPNDDDAVYFQVVFIKHHDIAKAEVPTQFTTVGELPMMDGIVAVVGRVRKFEPPPMPRMHMTILNPTDPTRKIPAGAFFYRDQAGRLVMIVGKWAGTPALA